MKSIEEYQAALKRLKENRPLRVPKGSKINKDTVALEAGRKRGSIKKSRPAFAGLIADIQKNSKRQNSILAKAELKASRMRSVAQDFESLYENALNRELMLLHKISQLEQEFQK